MTTKEVVGMILGSVSISAIASLIMGHFTMVSRFIEVNQKMDEARIIWISILIPIFIFSLYLSRVPIEEEE